MDANPGLPRSAELGVGVLPTSSDDAPVSPPTRTSLASRAPLVAPLALVAVTGYLHRQVIDDGFIYLRIVRQINSGNGPVFNEGERVETYTSPIWTAVLAAGDLLLPLRLEWLAVLLGIVLALAGVGAAMAGALHLARPERGGPAGTSFPVPVGALVFAAPFGVWSWHSGGMENGLCVAWLGGCLAVLARWASDRTPLGLGGQVLIGLGWLVRPELVVFSALFVLVVLAGEWRSRTPRRRVGLLAGMLAVPVAYQLFRMGFFGALVANTAIAKEGTSVQWNRGGVYLRDFVDPYLLWFPLAVLALGAYLPLLRSADGRRRAVVGAFVGGAVSVGLWVVTMGGDYFHARLFVPAFFALCAPVAAVPLSRRHAGALVVLPWVVLAVVALRPPETGGSLGTGLIVSAGSYGNVTLEDWGWDESRPDGSDLDQHLYLETNPFAFAFSPAPFEAASDLPDPALVASAIGLVSYGLGTDVHVVDTFGLAHPVGSRFSLDSADGGQPGHEKPMPPAWLAAEVAAPARTPAPDQLGTVSSRLVETPTGDAFAEQVDAARTALGCDDLQRLWRSTRGRYGPRRFVENVLWSPANTFLRIPPDPEEAVEELC